LTDPTEMTALVEQGETRQLLMRALALLPDDSRAALVAHVVVGASFAEIARRQGLAEATVKMRVHRGKRRLHQILTTTFAAETRACGLLDQSGVGWLATPLWCPRCGQRHLEGQWDFAVGTLRLRCRACLSTTGVYATYETAPELFRGVTSLKAGFNRVMRWVNAFYPPALERGGATCDCGRFLPVVRHLPPAIAETVTEVDPDCYRRMRGLHFYCPACDGTASMSLTNLALYTPPAWNFWSEQRRIRALPEQAVQFAGQAALRLTFQAVTGAAQLDVFVARATYAILAVH
jgi:hypothetical protein